MFSEGNLTAEFTATVPDAVVTQVKWCAGEVCNVSIPAPLKLGPRDHNQSLEFLRNWIAQGSNQELRGEVRKMLAKLNAVAEKVDRANVEATHPMTDQMREVLAEVNSVVDNGQLERLGASVLAALKAKLGEVFKDLRIAA
jgi:hypothetical protein